MIARIIWLIAIVSVVTPGPAAAGVYECGCCTLVSIGEIAGFWYQPGMPPYQGSQDYNGVNMYCLLQEETDPADSLALYVADNPEGPARKVWTIKPISSWPPSGGTVIPVRHNIQHDGTYYYWLDHGPGNFPMVRDPKVLDLKPNEHNPVQFTAAPEARPVLDPPDITFVGDSPVDNGDAIQLVWSLSTDDAAVDFYNIYCGELGDPTEYSWVGTVPHRTTSFTHTPISTGVTYIYKISAAHGANGIWNDFSGTASGTAVDDLQSGFVAYNTTWSGITYVGGDIFIHNGATLTIAAGTTVWVWSSDPGPNLGADAAKVEVLIEGGNLVVNGTSQNPVKFQAWNNGGPVNRANNKWAGIWVGDSDPLHPSGATINYAEIRNATDGLQARSSVTLTNSLIEDCKYIGVKIEGDGANVDSVYVYVENSIIRRVRGGGIGVNAIGSKAAIRLNSCVLDSCDMSIEVHTNAKVYTEQTTVKNSTYHGVKVYWGASANLSQTTVEGSAMNALKVFSGATVVATASTFKTSDYGLELGSLGGSPASATVTNCTFTANEVGANVSQGGTLSATGCQITGNTYEGVYCFAGSDVVLSASTFSGNAVGLWADGCAPELTDNTLTENDAGVICDNQSVPLLRRNTILSNEVGLEVLNDASVNVDACNGSCPSSCADANSIKLNVSYHIYNETDATLDVECTYWGGGPPGHANVYGPIDYIPYLTSDPLPSLTIELPVLPTTYSLSPNYPNPFNPTTTVALDVSPPGGIIQVRIFNVSGQLVKTLLNSRRAPGRYELTWDGSDDRGGSVASGIYFLDMIAPEFHSTRKLVLIK